MTPAQSRAPATTPVYLESGGKRVFACAVDWPGWCRSGKDAQAAVLALRASAPRYRAVALAAGERFPAALTVEVVERVRGNATTDFGAPGAVRTADAQALTAAAARRVARLVDAAWAALDGAVATAPAILRKGRRGGGRDRDEIVAHVLEAERAYAARIGVRAGAIAPGDRRAVRAFRNAVRAALEASGGEPTRWPRRYAARRIAWHVLDHVWEIEDKT